MEGASMKIIKYLIFAFNLIVFIVGLTLIIIGSLLLSFNDYLAFFGVLTGAAALVIIIGIICLVVGFFGCYGAFRENHCMIVTFAVLLCIILLLEMIAAITAFLLRAEMEELVRNSMKASIPKYGNDEVHNTWDHMQEQLKCCGVDSYMDWGLNRNFRANQTVPDSCCIDASEPRCAGPVLRTNTTSTIYEEGCADQLIQWSQKNVAIIGSIIILFACIQVVGIVLACILAGGIRQNYQKV